ncbi:GNAT family N-acetyltransferase [Roseateles oligotrophus]|uniref:GNAT family N-acetyltransferase n=1 Tax=Roseateles oligotrophus TaxID=1769250 RepID=A0ABT2YCZ7_9BURK|nr:GNAT family protein [Roseateles oligotrophus]MCV2367901.1 GNAT family N-acetyltransferase [Roseateles oligotrophus]
MKPIPPMQVAPVTLQGPTLRLEPLSLDHVDGLAAVGLLPELWRWVPTLISTPAEMRGYVELALEDQFKGASLPFALVLAGPGQQNGQVVGSSRFGNISLRDRRLEIGWTWVAPAWQRSSVNTEAKTLLLTHAFETLGAHRVELKTDFLNDKSRAAIARIGATQEGIFRRHIVNDNGRVRDTVYFSIIDSEWPAVKARLTTLRA